MKNLGKLMQQIHLAPVKESHGNKPLIKVEPVAKGSVYKREGIQAGDLVTIGKSLGLRKP